MVGGTRLLGADVERTDILPAGTTTGAADINVGDLNGDGRPDLVTSMGSANVVAVSLANAVRRLWSGNALPGGHATDRRRAGRLQR